MIDHQLPPQCFTRTGYTRPAAITPAGIVVHYISGRIAFPEDPFNVERIINEILVKYRDSYHYLIGRRGTVYRLVPEKYQAFHAGFSRWKGQDYCNRFMFGVAFASTGGEYNGELPYTTEQIQAGTILAADIYDRYHLDDVDMIAGHDQVRQEWNEAYPAKAAIRKRDPGPHFPWDYFKGQVAQALPRGERV